MTTSTASTDWGTRAAELQDKLAGEAQSAIEWLAHDLLNTAGWRLAKADEYPDDTCNRPAAKHLAEVAAELVALPADNPAVMRIEAAFDKLDPAETPALSDLIGSYGFGWGQHGQYYPDASEVLDRVAAEYESARTPIGDEKDEPVHSQLDEEEWEAIQAVYEEARPYPSPDSSSHVRYDGEEYAVLRNSNGVQAAYSFEKDGGKVTLTELEEWPDEIEEY